MCVKILGIIIPGEGLDYAVVQSARAEMQQIKAKSLSEYKVLLLNRYYVLKGPIYIDKNLKKTDL